jgi:hypothetical protein
MNSSFQLVTSAVQWHIRIGDAVWNLINNWPMAKLCRQICHKAADRCQNNRTSSSQNEHCILGSSVFPAPFASYGCACPVFIPSFFSVVTFLALLNPFPARLYSALSSYTEINYYSSVRYVDRLLCIVYVLTLSILFNNDFGFVLCELDSLLYLQILEAF